MMAQQKVWRDTNQERLSALRDANREKLNAKARAWTLANPENNRRKSKAWYDANRERSIARAKAWGRANPEKVRAGSKARRAANPEKVRAQKRAYHAANPAAKYGLNADIVQALIAAQNNLCPVCTKDLAPWPSTRTHVDHCHDTGKVRGILCHGCNSREGWVKRYGARLAEYLANPPAQELLELA